jgi:hypothetical protein
MFTKDFISKMENSGLTVEKEYYYDVCDISVFNGNIQHPIAFISDEDVGFVKIYNDVFELDKAKNIIDNVMDFFKTPKEERTQENYCLYYPDLSGNLRIIEKHYSSITSCYLFNESLESFKDIGELMNSFASTLNKDKYILRNVDIKNLSDNWKPESFGGNNNSIKYFKVESD